MSLVPVSTRFATHGMVCAPDHVAAEAGVSVLRAGGSAADAAIAANAVLGVTCPHFCGLGGDLWAVASRGSHESALALDASGRAGSGADPDVLRAAGYVTMPRSRHPACIPVPGCVDGWMALHDRLGVLSLSDILAPAQFLASDGFVAPPTLTMFAEQIVDVPGAEDLAASLQAGGRIYRPGVARALSAIAAGGRDAFYRGEFGAGLLALGRGEYREEDLARNQARWVTPLRLDAWGHQLWTPPPASQGYLTVTAAWMASGLDVPDDSSDPSWAHLLAEAARQARYDRRDVLYDGADGDALLARERLEPRRDAINPERVTTRRAPSVVGDTVAVCAVDGSGRGVSLLQSIASNWGAELAIPGLGIFLHNRGSGFSLQPGHPAEYRPGRRPPHTLAPLLVTRQDGTLRLVLATMGGDRQPQVLLQLLARLLHGAEEPGDAIAAARWTLGEGATLLLENHAPDRWADELARRGHTVRLVESFADEFGHAQVISSEPGYLSGASDPRSRAGGAVGW